jgi:hypothetical protein
MAPRAQNSGRLAVIGEMKGSRRAKRGEKQKCTFSSNPKGKECRRWR